MTKCPVCGSNNCSNYLTSKDFNQRKSNDEFTHYRCGECKAVFISPVPGDLGAYYGQDYPAYRVNKPRREELQIERLEQSKLNLVKHYAEAGRLIEVGPASGRFLKIAAESGYAVSAIEQDAECVGHVRNVLNIDVEQSCDPTYELENVTLPYDIFVAWHVIEHLEDPKRFVAAISKAINKPNGLAFISAPNPSAWSFKVFGRFWVHLDSPRHLILIPPEALDELMRENGLERVDCIFTDAVGLHLNRTGWISSSMNMSRNRVLRWALLAWVGRALRILALPFERTKARGAAYTAVYRNTGVVMRSR